MYDFKLDGGWKEDYWDLRTENLWEMIVWVRGPKLNWNQDESYI